MPGRCLMICVLIDWLLFLKGGLISGADCSVSTMAGVSMAPATENSFLRHHRMVLR